MLPQGARRVADIFDEVEEDLRAERARRLLSRYGGVLIGLAVLVILGVAGLQGWRWWEARESAAAAERYLAAAHAAEVPAGGEAANRVAALKSAAERFAAVAAEAPGGYRTLARLRAAALEAEVGERDAALATWDQASRDTASDPLYRDLATLMWALHALDSGDPAAIEARLAPLADGPWRASAEEIRALAALKRGETEAARQRLTALAGDSQAPQGVRERATRLLAGLGG
ncbi:hypothetical protein GCM10011504_42800 [Siccirubricoccus deserti]|nr:hypothetical protein GCM10011504_42800 [Siccirubricoccus deserti]